MIYGGISTFETKFPLGKLRVRGLESHHLFLFGKYTISMDHVQYTNRNQNYQAVCRTGNVVVS